MRGAAKLSFFVDQTDATTALQDRTAAGPRTGYAENVAASNSAGMLVGTSISEMSSFANAYDPMISALNEGRSKRGSFANPFSRSLNDPLFGPTYRSNFTSQELETRIWSEIEARRAADPSALAEMPKSRQALRDQIYQTAVAADRKAQDVGGRADFMGQVGQFVGTAGAIMTDPPVAVSMMMGVGAAAGIARTMVIEGLIGAGSEALVQPDVQAYRKKLGLDAGADQAMEAIGTAGLASAVLGGVIKGTGRVWGRLSRRDVVRMAPDQLLKTFNDLVKKPTAEQRAAKSVLETEADLAVDNPLEGRSGRAEHRARTAEAVQAAEDGTVGDMDPRPTAAIKPRGADDLDTLDGLVYAFDPADLHVDAKLFQFKSGGDGAGVTEALQGVTVWDPVKAGQVLVYEFVDGRRFVADGHQRLGLAQRVQGQNDGQRVRLIGQLLRETDGVLPEMARAIAAMKNMAEGSGSAIDAAKVLRVSPAKIGELPPRSQLVGQAQDLVNLSDDAFGMVVNEVVPAHFAAKVGRLIPDDPKLQAAAMDVLVRTTPGNLVQAEAIVRQVRNIGTIDEKQIGLFGEDIITKSLIVERARILDRAMKRLRKDKGVFKTLVANSGDIAKAGNRLADGENLKRMTNDETALQTLQKLANRKGPLSDALEDAARRAAESGNFNAATKEFVAAVRTAVARGDFEGSTIGRSRGAGDAEAQVPVRPSEEQAELDTFSEPAGAGAEQQAAALERAVRDVFELDVPGQERPMVLDDAVAVHPETGEGIVSAMRRAEKMPKTHEIATPERARLRQRIAEDLYGDGAVRQEFTVDLVLGPPAAGKSMFSDPLIAERGALLIDSDLAKEMLPEFEGGIGAQAVHLESRMIVEDDVLPRALARGDNIVWPMVGGDLANMEAKIQMLRAADYDVNVHLVEVPTEVAIERAIERFRLTGRLVSPQYVLEVADGPVRTFNDLIQRGDIHDHSHYSNDVPQGSPLRPVRDQGSTDLQSRSGRAGDPAQLDAALSGRSDAGTEGRAPSQEGSQSRGHDGQTSGLEPGPDLSHEIPVDVTVNENGDVIARTRPLGEVIDELDAEASFLDDLEGSCLK